VPKITFGDQFERFVEDGLNWANPRYTYQNMKPTLLSQEPMGARELPPWRLPLDTLFFKL